MNTENKKFIVDMEPLGRRAEIPPGGTLLDASRRAGVEIVSLCGGEGWCGSCKVRLANGKLEEPTLNEQAVLTEEELAEGFRLACQAVPLGDVKIEIPPDSLSTPQRLQTEGQELDIELNPPIKVIDIELDPPTLHDLRADTNRINDTLTAMNRAPIRFSQAVLIDISDRLRKLHWKPRLVVNNGDLIAVLPQEAAPYGLAVDIGTTKVAAYLLRLDTGETVDKKGEMNPQISYGEDVVSRIAYTEEHENGRRELQSRIVETLNEIITEMCTAHEIAPEQIVDAVLVGNTAMHHLFANLPVSQLGLSPYVPAVSGPFEMRARDIGLNIAPAALIDLPPNIAGYVGADHVSMILATNIWQEKHRNIIAADIGTNTEITLVSEGQMMSCSCASGPAFEGAHINNGMRAAAGAVERVQILDGKVHIYTIEDKPPVGICGSGILDVVAEMHSNHVIDDKGAPQTDSPFVRPAKPLPEFVLVPAKDTGHGHDIALTRKDINEVQLAKAAIRVGIDILLEAAGIEAEDLDAFIVAGAFGTYINIASAIEIGMFPQIPLNKFEQVGNAAGLGARQMLLSAPAREKALEISREVKYIELTTHPKFQDKFIDAMYIRTR